MSLCLCTITVAANVDSGYSTSYGATTERDSVHPRGSIRWNSNVSDSEERQWDLNYREAALYLRVECLTLLSELLLRIVVQV